MEGEEFPSVAHQKVGPGWWPIVRFGLVEDAGAPRLHYNVPHITARASTIPHARDFSHEEENVTLAQLTGLFDVPRGVELHAKTLRGIFELDAKLPIPGAAIACVPACVRE